MSTTDTQGKTKRLFNVHIMYTVESVSEDGRQTKNMITPEDFAEILDKTYENTGTFLTTVSNMEETLQMTGNSCRNAAVALEDEGVCTYVAMKFVEQMILIRHANMLDDVNDVLSLFDTRISDVVSNDLFKRPDPKRELDIQPLGRIVL